MMVWICGCEGDGYAVAKVNADNEVTKIVGVGKCEGVEVFTRLKEVVGKMEGASEEICSLELTSR